MKNKTLRGLDGINNKMPHQFVISDLIFAIRKNFQRNGITDKIVLSEISVSELNYEVGKVDGLLHNYNYDIVVCSQAPHSIYLIIEVEREHGNQKHTKEKIKDSLLKINTLEEVMLIHYDYSSNEIYFSHCTLDDEGELKINRTSSHCNVLNMNFVNSLVSFK